MLTSVLRTRNTAFIYFSFESAKNKAGGPQMAKRIKVARVIVSILSISLFAFGLAGCNTGAGTGSGGGDLKIIGAGATFPNPLYQCEIRL
jgi:predicted small secreted protein